MTVPHPFVRVGHLLTEHLVTEHLLGEHYFRWQETSYGVECRELACGRDRGNGGWKGEDRVCELLYARSSSLSNVYIQQCTRETTFLLQTHVCVNACVYPSYLHISYKPV